MAKFKTVTLGDFHWAAVETNGKQRLLHRQARVGHCMRPGQRYIEDGAYEAREAYLERLGNDIDPSELD